MKAILQICLVAMLTFVLAQFLPWWSVALAGALPPFYFRKGVGASFLLAFLGAGLLWLGWAVWISVTTGSALPDRVGMMMGPGISGMGVAALTAILGGSIAGLGGVCGTLLAGFIPKRPSSKN